jgi:protein SCO1/2
METTSLLRFLPQTRLARGAVLVSLALALAVVAFGLWRPLAPQATPTIGGAFALTDQFGKPRTDAEFRGRYTLVFFGFTNCPDVCPVELQTMSDALDRLGDAAAEVTPIFITVDPARDTPEALRDYTANFHPRLVALTGSAEAIGAVAKAYRVYYAKATGEAAPSDPAVYIMDHTAIVYLIGPDGRYVAHFSPGTAAEAMAEGIRERL